MLFDLWKCQVFWRFGKQIRITDRPRQLLSSHLVKNQKKSSHLFWPLKSGFLLFFIIFCFCFYILTPFLWKFRPFSVLLCFFSSSPQKPLIEPLLRYITKLSQYFINKTKDKNNWNYFLHFFSHFVFYIIFDSQLQWQLVIHGKYIYFLSSLWRFLR